MSEKGDKIRIIGGKYIGKTGWINKAKKATSVSTHVIILLDDEVEKATCIWSKNVAKASNQKPKTYIEAALQQQPAMEKLMKHLCHHLARCDVGGDFPNKMSLMNIIWEEIARPLLCQCRQETKDSKSARRNVSAALWLFISSCCSNMV